MNYVIVKEQFDDLDKARFITLWDRIKLLFVPMSKYFDPIDHIIMHYKYDKKGNIYIFKQDFINDKNKPKSKTFS